jgi:predicted metal-dependent phosphoesterase TrpH
MLQVDLHSHTGDDPHDVIPYSTLELIDRAAAVGLDALAITLHERQLPLAALADHAWSRGLVLIPGVERTIEGRHVLLVNFPPEAEAVGSFADVARLKARHPQGLVIAPHPFFPSTSCLRGLLHRHAALFDAVEWNACYTRAVNFNRAAVAFAAAHHKPVVASSDAHRLSIVGASRSLVDADRTPDAICAAIRAGRVTIRTRPLTCLEAATYYGSLALTPRRAAPRVPILAPSTSIDNSHA